MKYIFGFNVGVKLYKKFPKFKIFADGRLIDDLHLDESNLHKDTYIFNKDSYPDEDQDVWYQDRFVNKKIHLYKIDGNYLNKNITIDIENNDNNYTNGFMTNSTLVYFSNIFLIPENLHIGIPDLIKKRLDPKNIVKDAHQESNATLVSYWPCAKNHLRTYLGGNTVLNFPLLNSMKYKHFDNRYGPDSTYCSAQEIGFNNASKKPQFINVSVRYLQMLDEILNK